MKGQTQALTTVLITTVTIAAIATGYVWGTPLIEKRQSQASVDNIERSAVELHSAINAVAQSGKGSARTVDVEPDDGSIEINEDLDYIQVTSVAKNSPYPKDVWKLLKGSSMQNLSVASGAYATNQDSSGVVAVTSTGGEIQTIRYRIEFRNRITQDRIERIDLESVGAPKSTQSAEILVRNAGLEVENDYLAEGTKFNRYRTVVEVDIQ